MDPSTALGQIAAIANICGAGADELRCRAGLCEDCLGWMRVLDGTTLRAVRCRRYSQTHHDQLLRLAGLANVKRPNDPPVTVDSFTVVKPPTVLPIGAVVATVYSWIDQGSWAVYVPWPAIKQKRDGEFWALDEMAESLATADFAALDGWGSTALPAFITRMICSALDERWVRGKPTLLRWLVHPLPLYDDEHYYLHRWGVV